VSIVIPIATLLLVLVFALLEGFFSGSETGIYVVNRIRLRLRAEAGEPTARRLMSLLADTRGLITATLVGTNLCVFGTSALVTRLIEARVETDAALLSTLILSPFLFVFAEVVPKNLFRRHADVLMYRVSGLLRLSVVAFRPLVVALKGVTSIGGLLAGGHPEPTDPLRSRERLLSLLMTGAEEGILTPYQHDMAGNILRVASVLIERVMIPIEDVVVIEEPVGRERVVEGLSRAGHSRYPVRSADGSIERVLDVTEFLMADGDGGPPRAGLHEAPRLAADTPVPRALEALQTGRLPLGLVVNDADRPLGIITVKDLVEEIVGELGEW